jgi:hypothetical protein
MTREEIEIEINEEGAATIHVKGVKGKTCTKLTADLEKALGKVTGRKMTPEAREPPLQVKRWARH